MLKEQSCLYVVLFLANRLTSNEFVYFIRGYEPVSITSVLITSENPSKIGFQVRGTLLQYFGLDSSTDTIPDSDPIL